MINIKKQDFQGLIRLCQKGVQYYPDMLVFYYYKGLSHYQLDEQKQAIETFELGLRQEKAPGDEGMVSDMYSILGDLYHEQNQNEKDKRHRQKNRICLPDTGKKGCTGRGKMAEPGSGMHSAFPERCEMGSHR